MHDISLQKRVGGKAVDSTLENSVLTRNSDDGTGSSLVNLFLMVIWVNDSKNALHVY